MKKVLIFLSNMIGSLAIWLVLFGIIWWATDHKTQAQEESDRKQEFVKAMLEMPNPPPNLYDMWDNDRIDTVKISDSETAILSIRLDTVIKKPNVK